MGAAELRTFLREEFGIMNDEEFEAAVNASTGIDAMYIDDEAHDVKEIAEMENISEKIVYRDIGIACKILAVYLLGM